MVADLDLVDQRPVVLDREGPVNIALSIAPAIIGLVVTIGPATIGPATTDPVAIIAQVPHRPAIGGLPNSNVGWTNSPANSAN